MTLRLSPAFHAHHFTRAHIGEYLGTLISMDEWFPSSKRFVADQTCRTRDGTTVITSSYDNRVDSYLIPEDLLEPRDGPLTLRPNRTLQLAEPTNVLAPAPYYDIRFPNTDHFLVGCRDHPLHLYQALPPDRATPEDNAPPIAEETAWKRPLASYPLVSLTTEAHLPVHALAWPHPGVHFVVGSRDLIAQFDITRNGDGPVTRIPTIPSRRHIRKGNGVGMRGTVAALSAQTTDDDVPTGLIAAGTWTRRVGLYDVARGGECTSTWGVEEAAEGARATHVPAPASTPAGRRSPDGSTAPVKGIGGAGIIQTAWSPCGRYLLVSERQSTGMLVYDVRVTGRLLGFLAGRDALTHQRLSCDVFRGVDRVGGFEVWAGARDGTVKVWEGVGNKEGCHWPAWDFSTANGKAGGEALVAPAVGSVGLHHSGSVVATCSGCWTMPDDEGESVSVSSRPTSSDSDEESSDSGMSFSTSGPPSWRPDKKVGESCLSLWSIEAPAPPVHEAVAIGQTEQVLVSTEETNEIERYKQRVVRTLETIETEGAEPIDVSPEQS